MTDLPQDNHTVKALLATLTLDVSLYEHYLDTWPISHQEKQAFLETLWHVVCEFVYLGFQVSSVQQVVQEAERPTEPCSTLNSAICLDLDQVESLCKTIQKRGGEHA